MHKFIRKFRRGWRTYLLWWTVGALMFVPGMLGLVYYSIHEGDAVKEYVPELRNLAEQTPVYPGFKKDNEYVVLKRSKASFTTNYKSNAQFSDVKKFYDRVLGERGWRVSEQGGVSVYYRRGDYEIFLGGNDSGGWYSIAFTWRPE